MQFINDLSGLGIYFEKSEGGTGGTAQIVDSEYNIVDEFWAHTKKYAIQLATDKRRELLNIKTK
jgi:hypothetical protein